MLSFINSSSHCFSIFLCAPLIYMLVYIIVFTANSITNSRDGKTFLSACIYIYILVILAWINKCFFTPSLMPPETWLFLDSTERRIVICVVHCYSIHQYLLTGKSGIMNTLLYELCMQWHMSEVWQGHRGHNNQHSIHHMNNRSVWGLCSIMFGH